MNGKENETRNFREVQQFRQTWVWGLVLPISLFLIILFGYGMVKQLILGHPWGSKPMSDTALAIIGPLWVLFAVGLAYLFYSMKLITEVRSDGLYIRFFPLTHQRILFEEIRGCEVRTYNPIREFGGWGIRYGRGKKAYNVSGNRGVQLGLSNGKRLLIGSQRPEELAQAIGLKMKR
ncbi:MAG: hypothetical protein GTO13_18825 [Proteobacteria bacterium]|nr:hypothetical protein [Pseudomonadota bacterium]